TWLIPGNTTGSNLLNNGLFVLLKKVPTTDGAWATDPYEAQYLKLYDVTPPPAPNAPATSRPYAIGASAKFSWIAVADPEGGISGFHLTAGTSPGGSNVFDGIVPSTTSVTGAIGQTLYARVSAINNAGVEGSFSPNSSGTILLDPNGDYDGDGMNNANEDLAGTNPLDSNSVLRILSISTNNLVTWSSVSGKTYRVLATAILPTNFIPISGLITAANSTASFLDTGATNIQRFYRVNVLP
ncbi:MAG TPA: hypothetical protein VE988_19990, partial [Gemmataceae bacterium]|nr:hypothetical protein [Gemmataceae bacterium]